MYKFLRRTIAVEGKFPQARSDTKRPRVTHAASADARCSYDARIAAGNGCDPRVMDCSVEYVGTSTR